MKTIRCYCPYCGAPTTIESDNLYREYMFCAHCGSKILLTEDITSQIVDVGKIKQEENKKYIFDKKQEIRQQEKNIYDNLADEQRHRYQKLALFSFITFFLAIF